MHRNQTLRRTLALCFAMCGVACISNPYDGENIASFPTTTIPEISGWGTAAGQTVDIYAMNASGTFEWVTSTTTSDIGWAWDGTTWYQWEITGYSLPAAYWSDKPFGCGKKATIRAQIGGYFGVSVDQPFLECWDFGQTTTEFLETCQSDNSPDVTIDTCGALCC